MFVCFAWYCILLCRLLPTVSASAGIHVGCMRHQGVVLHRGCRTATQRNGVTGRCRPAGGSLLHCRSDKTFACMGLNCVHGPHRQRYHTTRCLSVVHLLIQRLYGFLIGNAGKNRSRQPISKPASGILILASTGSTPTIALYPTHGHPSPVAVRAATSSRATSPPTCGPWSSSRCARARS